MDISKHQSILRMTLNYGTIDLRIQNDYKSGILVKTYVSNSSVTVTFYGNKEGREVILEGPNTLSEKPVEKEITEDPTLAAGKEIQSDKGYPGSTVENIRIIKRPGKPDKVDRLVWTLYHLIIQQFHTHRFLRLQKRHIHIVQLDTLYPLLVH